MNGQNQCATLFEQRSVPDPLRKMFELQQALQKRLGIDYSGLTLEERTKWLMTNWTSLTSEFAETLERLPWKHWKKYSDDQKKEWFSEDEKVETFYELIDMFHFFLNMCLAMGLDHDTFVSLYLTKNEENFKRQERGY